MDAGSAQRTAPAIANIARVIARDELGAWDAILGYVLRDLTREERRKRVLDGIATHAYLTARGDGIGIQDAKRAGEAARREAERLLGDNAGA